MSYIDEFEGKIHNYIKDNRMIDMGDKIVVGVSGGADSMCLLKVLLSLVKNYNLKLYVVHINHGIRGKEAECDERFVRSFCDEHKEYIRYESFFYDIPNLAKEKKMSEEEAGRLVRYEAFKSIMNSYSAHKIAIAHNLNDNVETVVFNMCRGTGISGLKGIIHKSESLIRPLLCVTREEIEQYMYESKQDFRQDKTNFQDDYTRNKIRLNVIPYLEEHINSNIKEHINSLSNIAYETEKFMSSYVDKIFYDIVKHRKEQDFSTYLIDIELLNNQEHIIQQRIIRKIIYMLVGKLKDISNIHIEDIIKLSDKNVGKQIMLPYNIICKKNYSNIEVYIKDSMEEDTKINSIYEKIEYDKPYYIEYYHMHIIFECIDKKDTISIPSDVYTKWYDLDKISGDLVLRNRESGDKMQLNPNGTTKKLKDLMIDLKINKNERDSIPVVAYDSNILWLVGKRGSEAYRVDDNTRRILQIRMY